MLAAAFVWAVVILVDDGEWDALSSTTTILLAIAAFWVIWQNDEFRKRDRSEKLYNEIQDWANTGLRFVTRYRGNTRGDQFPKVWEAIAVLSYLTTKNLEKSIKDKKLSEAVKNARSLIDQERMK